MYNKILHQGKDNQVCPKFLLKTVSFSIYAIPALLKIIHIKGFYAKFFLSGIKTTEMGMHLIENLVNLEGQ
jgi:hypothetical protein